MMKPKRTTAAKSRLLLSGSLLVLFAFSAGCSLTEAVTGGFFAGISDAVSQTVFSLIADVTGPN